MSGHGVGRNRFELEGVELPSVWASETMRTIAAHESRRGFTAEPLGEQALTAILTAARSAPTSSNLQAYSIVVVRDVERKNRLAELVGDQRCVREAPVMLVFCADVFRLRAVCERQGHPFAADTLEMFLLASVDAALCMQNALTAAESVGLAGVPIGSVRNEPDAVAAELALPQGVFAVVGLALGSPRGPGRGVKPRLPVEATVHRERYSAERLDEALEAYDRATIARGIYRGRHVPAGGDPELDADDEDRYGWCEHTARRCSNPEHLGAASLRRHLREQVRRRGFSLD